MKKILIIFAAAILLPFTFHLSPCQAQYNETNNLFYHSLRTPQSNDLNAAFFPTKTSFYLRLPSIGMQFGSPISMHDMLSNQGDTLTVINLNKIFNSLGTDNNLHFDADINLFGLGFKVNNLFFTFNSRIVTILNLNIPSSLIDAVRQGNSDASGNPISEVVMLNGDIFNSTMYAEMAFGAGYRIEPINLTVGARIKYLYGLANVQTDNTSAVLTTSPGFNEIRADIYYEFLTAGVAKLDSNGMSFDSKNLLKGNRGFSFDIGARYDMGPFSFSFALNDLSAGIHWNQNISTIHPKDDHITLTFGGEDATTMLHGGHLNSDSLVAYYQNIFNGIRPSTSTSSADYWYSIPTKINLGANYSFAKKFRAGILFHGQLDRGLFSKKNVRDINVADVRNTFRFNTTLSFGVNLFNWAELIVGSSAVYDGSKLDLLNPGVGVVFTPATILQIYLMGDYISSFYLTEAKDFNIKFGMNILFGHGDDGRMSQD